MGIISILDKDLISQYSYAISYGKITEELLYYKQIYRYTELLESPSNFRLPNLEKYKDITDLSNFHQLGKIVLQKNFETSFRNVVKFNNSLSHPKDPQHLYPIAVRYISSDGVYYIERPPFQIEVDSNCIFPAFFLTHMMMVEYVWDLLLLEFLLILILLRTLN